MCSEGYSTLFVCQCVTVSLTVSDTTLQASVVNGTLKFRHQRSVNDALECFNSWILLTMLASRDMAKFVSQEAYERANLPDQQLWLRSSYRFCVSERFPVGCLICLRVQACLYARLVLVVVVWFILER